MKWTIIFIYLCIAYYTLKHAKVVWKQGYRFASIFVVLLAVSLVVIPITAFMVDINFINK
ncbi:MAG: hypothetical protein Q8936_08980 [Bacillota bacterium]|nr:hypothetical protein [Bacillota bacterium]